MDYSKTVILPKTGFPMQGNLPKLEPEILDFWEKAGTYKRLLEKKAKSPVFILHDGPPYANGPIHIGHALNKILKDIIVKYKDMTGFYAPYVPGWDCHGLPIEHQLMKELKVNKRTVDRYNFRKEAKAYAQKFVDLQRDEFKRLGIFGHWEKPYLTMESSYESAEIKIFGKLLQKGYIYRSTKPVYWCTECETALAEAEVEYEEKESDSIYVKFELINGANDLRNASFVIWTTTPWTLPANVGVMLHPQLEYALVESDAGKLILAENLVENLTKKTGANYKITAKFPGAAFANHKYKHCLGLDKPGACPRMSESGAMKCLLDVSVETNEGTGIVHLAPGHGNIDYTVGHARHKLPIISPVDETGRFTVDCGLENLKGINVLREANRMIIDMLKSSGHLLYSEKIRHSYPHCWRCKNPVIFRATKQWFININHEGLREKLTASVDKVQWIPDTGKSRMKGHLETRPDWCISRQRHWGTPIPALYCKKCGEPLLNDDAIAQTEKIFREKGSDAWFTEPVEIFLPQNKSQQTCQKCQATGPGNFERERDILDVWFDSGVSWEAVLNDANRNELAPLTLTLPSPPGGEGTKEIPSPLGGEGRVRGEIMYLEGSDQHRGWFQSSLIPSVAITNNPPYNTVLTHGFVLDGEGQKMSKSRGNVIAPQDVIAKHGAEVLRLWVAISDCREDVRISPEILNQAVETYRKIRNTIRFLLGGLSDFNSDRDRQKTEAMLEIDRWCLNALDELTVAVTTAYNAYEFHTVIRTINVFCVTTLSNFYLDTTKDRLYTFKAKDPARLSCQTVFNRIIHDLLVMLAPILPFTTEQAWAYLRLNGQFLPDTSVFFQDWPTPAVGWDKDPIKTEWADILSLRAEIYTHVEQARRDGVIKSPLEAWVTVKTAKDDTLALLKRHEKDWPMILIVSNLEILSPSPLKGQEAKHSRALVEGGGEGEDNNNLLVTVKHSRDYGWKKCARCWRWQPDVDENTGNICDRCISVVESTQTVKT